MSMDRFDSIELPRKKANEDSPEPEFVVEESCESCDSLSGEDLEERPSFHNITPFKDRPVSELNSYIQELARRKGDYDGFDEEFNFIEERSSAEQFFGDFKSAVNPQNRTKNRYSNVLPLEKTRVKLRPRPGMPSQSDYINANYINGEILGSEKAYIATQGPLPDTTVDFWQMIWDENTKVVVMLTKLIENRKVKCHCYWPQHDTVEHYGELVITNKSQTEYADGDIIRRNFFIENTSTSETRDLVHFQYCEWPDHGLPKSTAHFRELLHLVQAHDSKSGPIAVHCSAGIGRTGTFCTVKSTIEQLMQRRRDNLPVTFNILEAVLRLRCERVGMVQTRDQYMFCYLGVLEECLEKGLVQANNVSPDSTESTDNATDDDTSQNAESKKNNNNEDTEEEEELEDVEDRNNGDSRERQTEDRDSSLNELHGSTSEESRPALKS